MEEWKKLDGYEYDISTSGRVKSLRRNIILSQRKDYAGYYYVNLYADKRKTFKVHQLVAMVFMNHKPCGMRVVVDHINNNKEDNNRDNLQLISCRLNNQKDKKNLGISYHKKNSRYYVRINGISYGSFGSIQEATEKRDFLINEEKS